MDVLCFQPPLLYAWNLNFQEFPRARVYGAARSGAQFESIVDDSQIIAMDVTSEASVAAAVSLILRKHKVHPLIL